MGRCSVAVRSAFQFASGLTPTRPGQQTPHRRTRPFMKRYYSYVRVTCLRYSLLHPRAARMSSLCGSAVVRGHRLGGCPPPRSGRRGRGRGGGRLAVCFDLPVRPCRHRASVDFGSLHPEPAFIVCRTRLYPRAFRCQNPPLSSCRIRQCLWGSARSASRARARARTSIPVVPGLGLVWLGTA